MQEDFHQPGLHEQSCVAHMKVIEPMLLRNQEALRQALKQPDALCRYQMMEGVLADKRNLRLGLKTFPSGDAVWTLKRGGSGARSLEYLWGVTKTIRECFRREEVRTAAYKSHRTAGKRKQRETRMAEGSAVGMQCMWSPGSHHGKRVHDELEQAVKALNNPSITLASWLKHKQGDVDGCTLRVLHFIAAEGWVPRKAEMRVYDERVGLATSIDMICYDSTTAGFVAIELKTGYEGVKFTGDSESPKLRGVMRNIIDCPYQTASLQLVLGLLMAHQNYGLDLSQGRAYIVRACPSAARVYALPLPDWAHHRETPVHLFKSLVFYYERRQDEKRAADSAKKAKSSGSSSSSGGTRKKPSLPPPSKGRR